ncbi:integrase [Marinilactibacillus sp. 15R]|uniref:IS21 family transposase n=1 Tax=Marinilactibacillus sp. 15R TaxID=1911586 RepID=UPI00090CA426|nr:IS21 family transposase [Marinilactibacillus sp. 15R]API88049.1 integrase [Marinilactibacillus sp. 15R]
MARKIPVKRVIQYRDQGFSRNMIAKTQKVGRSSVSDVFKRADELNLSYEDIKELSDKEAYRLFFPERYQSEVLYTLPEYDKIHKELQSVGVTLKLLWQEYVDQCNDTNGIAVGYTKFCEDYQKHIDQYRLTNPLTHKPGVSIQVDWSGATMQLLDPATGELRKVYLFVGTLPYSQYTYVEPTLDMKSNTWLHCHMNMFAFFGGTTVRLICDNLKTGVISHPKEGDIILNEQYEALANHYVMAVMPAQVRKPKQKAAVEGAVGKIATAVIASLRNELFTSMGDLKIAIREKMTAFNETPFQKREGSRQLIFAETEQAKLRPLPLVPYEIAEWVYGRKVKLDCHISYQKNHYSCPYQYVKKKVDLKVTHHFLEIYFQDERIATHKRFPQYKEYAFSTSPEHLPDQFNQLEWNDQRLLNWGLKIGPYTHKVIQRVFENLLLKEQGYQSCLSILNLSKKYSNAALETACQVALEKVYSPKYRQLNAILTNPANNKTMENAQSTYTESMGFVRGADYYGGKHNDK